MVILSLFVYQTSRTNVPCSIHPMYLFIFSRPVCLFHTVRLLDTPRVHYFNIVLKNTLLHSLVATALSAAAWARTLIFHVPFFER